MTQLLLKIVDWIQRRVKSEYLRLYKDKLEVKDFTVISNNCWGGILYKDLNLPYGTPFVNMFMFADCYLKLVKNLDRYLASELTLSNVSRYFTDPSPYPIGFLDDIEIHFIHYTFKDPIIELWNRRKKRINRERIFFVLSERDGCKPHHVQEFQSLKYNKFAITRYRYSGTDVYRVFPFQSKTVLPADILMGFSYRAINPVLWLNKTFQK